MFISDTKLNHVLWYYQTISMNPLTKRIVVHNQLNCFFAKIESV